jgi:hypothetical protein
MALVWTGLWLTQPRAAHAAGSSQRAPGKLRKGMLMGMLTVAGFGYVTQTAGTMMFLQSASPAGMRGRMMGLFSTLFVGMAPFGALAGGIAAARFGVPRTLLSGALAVLAASLAFRVALPRLQGDRA